MCDVTVGDLVTLDETFDWQVVQSVETHGDHRTLTVSAVHDDTPRTLTLPGAATVLWADGSVVHRPSEFLGLSAREAEALAGALGWRFRNMSEGGWFTQELRHDRVNVWIKDDVVTRAELG